MSASERRSVAEAVWHCGAPECGGHQGVPPVTPERYWTVACVPMDAEPGAAPAAEAEWWGVAEAASHCGILPGTWRDYVARGRAPQPDDPDEGAPKQRRRPRWRAETVTAWQASRPRAARREEAAR